MARIGILSHTRDVIDIAREIAFETGHELVVQLGIPNRAGIEKARLLQNHYQVDAIIAHGANYEKIHDQVDIPVTRLDISNFQLANVLRQASKVSEKLVFVEVQRESEPYSLDTVKQLFDFTVDKISMSEPEESTAVVDAIVERGYGAVVTAGRCILNQLPDHVPGFCLSINKQDVLDAVLNAVQVIEAGNKKREKISWMQTIVDNIEEGIITLDKTGNIETFNSVAEEITGFSAGNVLQHNIKTLLNHQILNDIYDQGVSVDNKMIASDAGNLIVNRIPIQLGSEQRGLVIKLQKVTKIQKLEQTIRKELLNKGFVAKATFPDIAGESAIMRHLKKIAEKYAAASANIIIEGESGTGKELFAQSIHNSSTFRTGPFVAVNCAALSESLLESELFGYEEGAFTGAKRGGKPGLFELAHNGTIFLDEIGDMPCSLQSRLLRVIQEKEVIRIGGSRVIPVNNRFVCATNKNLLQEVEKGNFRQDLYYRINILQVRIPSLRDRAEDIPQIAQVLFSKACKEMKKKISMQPTYLEMLKEYHWPGNVRELEAFVERLLSITAESRVEYEDFISCFDNIKNKTHCPSTSAISSGEPQMESGKLQISLGNIKTMEDEIIRQVLRYANGDKDRVEKILGISKTTLWRKTKDFPEIACVR